MQKENVPSVLTIDDRKKIAMTGVAAVESVSDRLIVLKVNGMRVKIEGAKLKVLAFSEGSGNFSASGEVTSVRYGAGGRGLSGLLK